MVTMAGMYIDRGMYNMKKNIRDFFREILELLFQAAAITSQTGKARLPTHIELSANTYGLPKESVVLLEQIRTLDKRRLREHMGRLDEAQMQRVDNAIAVSFGLHTDTMV